MNVTDSMLVIMKEAYKTYLTFVGAAWLRTKLSLHTCH